MVTLMVITALRDIYRRCAYALPVALVLLGLCLTGCGGPREILGKVSGKVTFQGEPVSEGLVIFSNTDKGVYMTAKLGPDGSYAVKMAEGSGLPLGTYQVSITPPLVEVPLGPMLTPPKPRAFPNIPPKYRRNETSGLTLTVEQGDNTFDVDMEKRASAANSRS